MTAEWRQYQSDAGTYFRSLGLHAEVEASIDGARGSHEVDVLVSGTVYGLTIRWIVECKYWSSNIPKEKVLALQAIVQDVGADRGILLSETGFQSGAIRVSRSTNITLTSLTDLRETARDGLVQEAVIGLHWRWSQVMKQLSAVHRKQKEAFGYITPALKVKVPMMFLDSALEEGLRGEFPTVYALGEGDERLSASTLEELISGAVRLIETAESYAQEQLTEDAQPSGGGDAEDRAPHP